MPQITRDTDINAVNGLSNGQQAPSQGFAVAPNFQPPTSTDFIRKNLAATQYINKLQFPDDMPKYWTNLGMSTYNRASATRAAIINPTDNILLPLPLQLMDNHGVAYDEVELGRAGGAFMNNAPGLPDWATKAMGGSPAKTQQGTANPNVSNPAGYFKQAWDWVVGKAEGVAGAAGSAVLDYTGTLGQAAQAAYGYSPNQFLTILLKGPMYKRNEFTWKFAPRSPSEARAINKIVRKLNNAMAPGLQGGGFLFSFPKIFTVSFMPNSQYLFKMKPCVLENMVINYTPGGRNGFMRADPITAGYWDGGSTYMGALNAPESVEIRVRFLELEYWLKDDFIEDNDPSNVSAGA